MVVDLDEEEEEAGAQARLALEAARSQQLPAQAGQDQDQAEEGNKVGVLIMLDNVANNHKICLLVWIWYGIFEFLNINHAVCMV